MRSTQSHAKRPNKPPERQSNTMKIGLRVKTGLFLVGTVLVALLLMCVTYVGYKVYVQHDWF